jgi:hypothetical protein
MDPIRKRMLQHMLETTMKAGDDERVSSFMKSKEDTEEAEEHAKQHFEDTREGVNKESKIAPGAEEHYKSASETAQDDKVKNDDRFGGRDKDMETEDAGRAAKFSSMKSEDDHNTGDDGDEDEDLPEHIKKMVKAYSSWK